MPIYDAAMRYAEEETPLVILAGKEYGSGSSRDWAAKRPPLLGVRAVIASPTSASPARTWSAWASSAPVPRGRVAAESSGSPARRRGLRHGDPRARATHKSRGDECEARGKKRRFTRPACASTRPRRSTTTSTAASCRLVLRQLLFERGAPVTRVWPACAPTADATVCAVAGQLGAVFAVGAAGGRPARRMHRRRRHWGSQGLLSPRAGTGPSGRAWRRRGSSSETVQRYEAVAGDTLHIVERRVGRPRAEPIHGVAQQTKGVAALRSGAGAPCPRMPRCTRRGATGRSPSSRTRTYWPRCAARSSRSPWASGSTSGSHCRSGLTTRLRARRGRAVVVEAEGHAGADIDDLLFAASACAVTASTEKTARAATARSHRDARSWVGSADDTVRAQAFPARPVEPGSRCPSSAAPYEPSPWAGARSARPTRRSDNRSSSAGRRLT